MIILTQKWLVTEISVNRMMILLLRKCKLNGLGISLWNFLMPSADFLLKGLIYFRDRNDEEGAYLSD